MSHSMRVLFIDTVHPILQERLEAAGYTCIDGTQWDRKKVEENLPEIHGIVIRSRFKLDTDFLEKATALRFIARSGAGMENIDIQQAEAQGITLFHAPEGNRDAVGEQVVGMLLMLFNNLARADHEVRSGLWKREANRGYELQGKTVGIIGYGNMGRATAQRLSGFDCRVLAYDKYVSGFADDHVKECSLEELQREADIMSLHVPLTAETRYMVNTTFIEAFSKPFYLVNTARGPVVETPALVEALQSGKVRGACLDVLEYEGTSFEKLGKDLPPAFQYLVQSDKVVLTPHIAGWTHESYEKLSQVLADKILRSF